MMRLGLPLTHIEYEYSQKMFDGVKEFVNKTGNDYLVFISKEPQATESEFSYQEWAVSKFMNKKNMDGLLFPTAAVCRFITEDEMAKKLYDLNKDLPVFSVTSNIKNIPSLTVEGNEVYKTFISHLIEKHNKKRFAFMGIKCHSGDILLRYQIFKEVLKEHNIPFDENLFIYGDYTLVSSIKAMENRFKSKEEITFDALVCVTDEMALGAIEHLTRLGVDVPSDVVVTGYDNTMRSLYCLPSLSTIDQRVGYQIYCSSELLTKIINGQKIESHTKIKPSCCMRASCGCLDKYETRYTEVDENGNFILREEKFYNKISSSLFDRRDQNLKVLDFIEELQSNLSLERLAHRLKQHLLDFEIYQCAICLYQDPVIILPNEEISLPDKARLYYFSSSKESETIIDDQNYFDCSKALLPENMLEEFKGVQIVKMLYHGEQQYGYMIMYSDLFDGSAYQLLFSLFSKFIASAYTVTLAEKEQSNLEQINLNLSKLSKTDELTGILNRRGFIFTAQQQLNIAASLCQKGLVIYGDIDGLKYINDTFGHDAGDRAILAEVDLLTKTFRATDIIGRFGGDEFAILSISLSLSFFEKLRQRLEDLCKEWNEEHDEPFKLSISLGAVEFNKKNFNLLELLKKADAEQYKVKRAKKACRTN